MQLRSAELLFQNYLWKRRKGSFSAVKGSLETICPWEPGMFAADRHRWAEDAEGRARGCACPGVWLHQGLLLTCPAPPPPFLGHPLLVASPWIKERNGAAVEVRENLPLQLFGTGLAWNCRAGEAELCGPKSHLQTLANLRGCFLLSWNRNEFTEIKWEKKPQHTQGERVIHFICCACSQAKITHPFIRKTEYLFEVLPFFFNWHVIPLIKLKQTMRLFLSTQQIKWHSSPHQDHIWGKFRLNFIASSKC